MNRSYRCLLSLILVAGFSSVCSIPGNAQNYLYGTGNQTWGVNIPIENGFINVANGQLHFELTLANHAQRGSLSLNEELVYDSRIWQVVANGSSYSFQPTNVPNSQAGWRFVKGNEPGSIQTISQSQTWPCSLMGGAWIPQYNNIYFTWTDPSGAVHPFPGYTQQPMSGVCIGGVNTPPNSPTMTGYAADGSGYYISVTNYTSATIFDPNGNAVSPTPTDRNGNFFSADANGNLIDTLGRTPVVKTQNGSQTYYDVLTIGGATKRYTVTTETISVHTAFGQSGVNEYSGSLTAVQSIGLPDGTSYTFNYDSGTSSGNYGELQSITLPTGGAVYLGYQNYLDSYQNQNRWLSSYSGGYGSYTFTPQVVTQCTGSTKVGCQEKVTATDGNGNQIVYLLTLNNGAWNSQVDSYNGSSSHIMSTATSYNFSTSCQTYNCSGAQWITASSIVTTLSDSGQITQAQYAYSNPAIAKPTAVKTWDYYTGSPSSTPTKETDYTYGYYVNGGAFLTLLKQLDSSGNLAAQTIYHYDENAPSTTSGLPNHGAAPGSRGNLTSTTAGIGSTVTTRSTFDDAGTKLSDIDGRSYTTGYSSMCSDAFVQTVTLPVSVGGQNLQSKTTYDCSSDLVTSTQDINGVATGQSTTYTYYTSGANIGRLQLVSNPDGGSTTFSFPSATETDQVVAQTASVNVTTKSVLDGFGRPYQTATYAPEGTISSETSYDPTGRPGCVTAAHLQGTPLSTDGSTCTYYDVLGRTTKTALPDGNFSTASYSGATQTVTDELGHNKKYTYDAFHRLTAVLEPNATGTLTYETDYQYSAMDKLTQVDQWGGARGSSGDRQRLFAYDSLGRMIAENVPENQSGLSPASLTCPGTTSGTKWTMCSSPDASGNTAQTTDNAGNVVNFSYDALNRVTQETASNGSLNYSYVYDDATHSNSLGKLSFMSNNINAAQAYYYDPMGRLTSEDYCVPQNCSYSIWVRATYDLAGNMTSLTYPDGRVVSQSFDGANRFNGVQYSKWGTTSIGTPYYSVSAFAPPGQPTSSTFGNGVGIAASFNNRQNISSLKYTNASGTLWSKQFTWDKNAANMLLLTDNVTGQGRLFGYDTLNRLTSAVDVQPNLSTATATVSINGSEQSYTFNPCPPNVQPCWQTINDGGSDGISVGGINAGQFGWGAGSTSSSLASLLASNINANSSSVVSASASGSNITLTSKVAGPAGNYDISISPPSWNTYFSSPSFTVSAPSSMSGGSVGGPPVSGGLNESYTYDPFGNLTQSGTFPFSQSFNALNQISGYNYDANGEETTDIYSHPLAYNANGMLTSVSNGGETYVYDAAGNRVEVHGSTTTDYVYFGVAPIALLSGGSYTDLIYAAGTPVAEVGGTQSAVPTYRVTDSLASFQGDALSSGGLASATNYAPYGQLFSGSYTTDTLGFTGMQWDSTTAMWHATARQFSPQQGRWMSPDPYSGSYDWSDPQTLNRYSYVNGKPVWSTDPSGRDPGTLIVYAYCTDTFGAGCFNPVGLIAAAAVGVFADLAELLGFWAHPAFHGSLEPRPTNPKPNKLCNNKNAVDFVKGHQADAAKIASQYNTSTANVLGLSARESGYGSSSFTSGNAFFNLETKVAQAGQTPNKLFAYSSGWMQAGKDPLVYVAKYPDYYSSALGFFSRYGSAVKGVQNPTAFLSALKGAGFNSGPKFTDPTVLNDVAERMKCP